MFSCATNCLLCKVKEYGRFSHCYTAQYMFLWLALGQNPKVGQCLGVVILIELFSVLYHYHGFGYAFGLCIFCFS